MNQKQTNILIVLGLFLLFNLITVVAYQNLTSSIKLSKEKSEELISSHNVRLNRDQIRQLAAKINPDSAYLANELSKKAEISWQEPVPVNIPRVSSIGIYLYNGSGVPGEAATIAELLQKKGYFIEKIDNADQNDYQKTVIIYGKEDELLAKDLQNLLKSLYNEIILKKQEDQSKIEIVLGEPAQTPERR